MFHHRRIHRMLSVMALIVMVLVLLGLPSKSSAAVAMAATYYASSDPTGLTCSIFYPCSLQMAVDKAVDGDTVIVEEGTYRSTGAQVLLIDEDVIIQGGWNGGFGRGYAIDPLAYPTVLDGEKARQVVKIENDASPTLSGLLIENGYIKEGDGGGVAVMNLTSGDVRIEQCLIRSNYAGYYGGGISIYKGSLTIRNSSMENNATQYGGGAIMAGIGTTVTLENNIFGSNVADYGSVGHFDRANLAARSNLLAVNTGNPAISINSQPNQTVILENNLMVENNGAAVSVSYSESNAITFLHNTLVGNVGMGLSLPGNTSGIIANNIFLGHSSDSIGVGSGSSVAVSNNLFWKNGGDPFLGTGAVQEDPLLNSQYHLSSSSPAMNAGAVSAVKVDIDGQKRPIGLPDIGADEVSIPLYIPAVTR